MCKTKILQLVFPTYLVCVHMVLSHMSVSGNRQGNLGVTTGTSYFHLYNMHSGLHVEVKGKIPYANSTKKTNYTKLEVKSHPMGSNSMMEMPGQVALTLMGKQAGRFLCFNKKGKLITRFTVNNATCLFEEVVTEDGSYEFHLFDEPSWKLGFNHRGKPLQATSKPMRHTESGTKFLKRGKEHTLHQHISRPGPVHSSDTLADSIRIKGFQEPSESRLRSNAQLRRRRSNSRFNVETLSSAAETQQTFLARLFATRRRNQRSPRTLRLSSLLE